AGERFAIELTPSTFPQRHFAGDMFPQRHVAGERVGILLGKASNVVVTTIQNTIYSKMNLIGNIDPEAKQWLVDRNLNSWCRAFFKMDRGCAAYENSISESYHNAIRIARIIRKGDTSYGVNIENRTCACKWRDLSGVPCVHSVAAFSFLKMDPVLGVSAWYSKKMWENACSYFIRPVGGSAMWQNTSEEPPLPPVFRKMPGRPRKLRIKHVTERVNVITRSGRMMTCHNCWEKGHNRKSCKNKKQPQPTIEKRTPGRKKADSNFVFPTGGKNGGDAGPSIADPTDSEVGCTVTEDPIKESQLKTGGLKRRCKSERIAKRAKPFQFGKDGAGSCADKAWDVDEVLAEE
ncbi:60S ribosomal protein L34, partial [Tanacetum coccineum]